ncbi:MAG: MarR family winged helix-turn-helix transcriptional regulator [bacterium JZ-2024 1]
MKRKSQKKQRKFPPNTGEGNILDARIVDAMERISTAMRSIIRKKSYPEGLTVSQVSVMEHISQAPMGRLTVSDLSRELRASKASLSETVNLLVRKGLIKRIPSKTDRRCRSLTLTKKGIRVMNHIRTSVVALTQALREVPEEVRPELFYGLLAFIRGLLKSGYLAQVRMCLSCRFFGENAGPEPERPHFCTLLQQPLSLKDLRINCPDFQAQKISINTNLPPPLNT